MNTNRLKLLAIDDSLADFRVLRSYLNQAYPNSFELTHKVSADDGLAAIAATQFDCVFLDYMLDDDDGLELLRQVRESGSDVPIIAVSGNGSEQVAVEALQRGAQDYLVKGSLTPESVERALCNAMEKVALQRQLTEKNQELTSFTSVAAHDLQAPLRRIVSYAEWILEDAAGDLDNGIVDKLQIICKSAVRMQELVTSLLEFTRVGRSQAELTEVDLNETLAAVVENLEADLKHCKGEIQVASLPTVRGHELSLCQLFQNLVSNAIKFCRDRTPLVKISAHETEERDFWVVSVTDNGIGIAPEHLDEILVPFRQLHGHSEFEGSGIGLATCQRIVNQHGGEICIESELGQGTTFHVTLPMVDSRREADSQAHRGETASDVCEREGALS